MSTIAIKRATVRDVDCVSDLFDQYRKLKGVKEDPAAARIGLEDQLASQERIIFVAVSQIGGVLQYLGFAQLRPSASPDSNQKEWVLSDLFVIPEVQDIEIEKALLSAVLNYTKLKDSAGVMVSSSLRPFEEASAYESHKQSV